MNMVKNSHKTNKSIPIMRNKVHFDPDLILSWSECCNKWLSKAGLITHYIKTNCNHSYIKIIHYVILMLNVSVFHLGGCKTNCFREETRHWSLTGCSLTQKIHRAIYHRICSGTDCMCVHGQVLWVWMDRHIDKYIDRQIVR